MEWFRCHSFVFFFSLKQMKRYGIIILFSFCWDNHWTDLVDSLDNSAISFYSSGTWPGFFKGRGGGGREEEEGCHTVSNREYSPDCHVDLSWIGYSGILRRPVPLSPLFILSACQNLIAIVNYWGKISVGMKRRSVITAQGIWNLTSPMITRLVLKNRFHSGKFTFSNFSFVFFFSIFP